MCLNKTAYTFKGKCLRKMTYFQLEPAGVCDGYLGI